MTRRATMQTVAILFVLILPAAIGTSSCGGAGENSSSSLPISVTISVTASTVITGGTTSAVATVANDPSNQGVTWSLTQSHSSCSPACGTLSSKTSASGATVTYSAPVVMPASASVTVTATSVAGPTSSNSATITILPPAADVTFIPPNLNFGNVAVGDSKMLSTVMTNSGGSTLSITSMEITGAGASNYTKTGTCGTSLAATQSCTVAVTFKPNKSGFIDAQISISDDGVGSPQIVPLSGKGKAAMNTTGVRAAFEKYATTASPNVTGPNRVGTREMELVDATRDDPYATDGSPRDLLVRFWYPAQSDAQCQPAAYASPKVWRRFSELIGARLPNVTTNSCADAPVLDGAHPVVVFTPGFTGTFTDYTFLFEDLASRGYVIASVAHTYETTAVEFPDGRFFESALGSYLGGSLRGDAGTMAFAVIVRLGDLEFVLNELNYLNAAADSPFGGKLDTSRIALAGHSMGGVTALLGVEQDTRFKVGIVIDGDIANGLSSPTQTPILIMGMGRQQWSAEGCRLWTDLRGGRFAVNFLGAEHMTPTDGLWIARGAISPGEMSAETTVASLRNYVAAFLDANLRGQPWSPLLLQTSPDYRGAVVTTQNESLCTVPE
jgi:dienelactone hydrolase